MRYGVFEITNGEQGFLEAHNSAEEAVKAVREYYDYADKHYAKTVKVDYVIHKLFS